MILAEWHWMIVIFHAHSATLTKLTRIATESLQRNAATNAGTRIRSMSRASSKTPSASRLQASGENVHDNVDADSKA